MEQALTELAAISIDEARRRLEQAGYTGLYDPPDRPQQPADIDELSTRPKLKVRARLLFNLRYGLDDTIGNCLMDGLEVLFCAPLESWTWESDTLAQLFACDFLAKERRRTLFTVGMTVFRRLRGRVALRPQVEAAGLFVAVCSVIGDPAGVKMLREELQENTTLEVQGRYPPLWELANDVANETGTQRTMPQLRAALRAIRQDQQPIGSAAGANAATASPTLGGGEKPRVANRLWVKVDGGVAQQLPSNDAAEPDQPFDYVMDPSSYTLEVDDKKAVLFQNGVRIARRDFCEENLAGREAMTPVIWQFMAAEQLMLKPSVVAEELGVPAKFVRDAHYQIRTWVKSAVKKRVPADQRPPDLWNSAGRPPGEHAFLGTLERIVADGQGNPGSLGFTAPPTP